MSMRPSSTATAIMMIWPQLANVVEYEYLGLIPYNPYLVLQTIELLVSYSETLVFSVVSDISRKYLRVFPVSTERRYQRH